MNIFQNPQKTDEGVTYYETPDALSKKPLLLIHGEFGSARIWERLINYLVSENQAVLAVDLPGHGASEGRLKELSVEDYLSSIEAISRLSYSKPILVGHGLGGLLALASTSRDIAEEVVAINPSPTKEIAEGKIEDEAGVTDIYSLKDVMTAKDIGNIFDDLDKTALMKIEHLLGKESFIVREDIRNGISIDKSELEDKKALFLASEGESYELGVNIKNIKAMSSFYEKPIELIESSSHPGIIMGENSHIAFNEIIDFVQS